MVRVRGMDAGAGTWLAMLALVVLATACAVTPRELETAELEERMHADLRALALAGDDLDHPLGLDEAIDRALAQNLDLEVELRRKAVAERELQLSRLEMLPQMLARVGWNARDSFQAAESISLLTNTRSLEPSYSQEKSIVTSDLGLSWNLLDFGLSWVRAHQAADRVLVIEEQRRVAAHRMVERVRAAWWRAASAERLLARAGELEERVARSLAQSQESRDRRLTSPLLALTYERELIGIRRELLELQRQLAMAKVELASLCNVRPGRNFQVDVPEDDELRNWKLDISLHEMERHAFMNRPELREQAYEERITVGEGYAALLDLLPHFDVYAAINYNSNELLVNADWWHYGVRISYNLLRVFALPKTLAKIEADHEVLGAQRRALAMTVLSQVHVSHALLQQKRLEFEAAARYANTQSAIVQQVGASARASRTSEQTLIREEMNMLYAEARRDVAYAEFEQAHASLLAAIGFDPQGELPTREVMPLAFSEAALAVTPGNTSVPAADGVEPPPARSDLAADRNVPTPRDPAALPAAAFVVDDASSDPAPAEDSECVLRWWDPRRYTPWRDPAADCAAELPSLVSDSAAPPVAESPVAESPVAESPVEESPVAESPVAESPVTESPAAESPVAESPVEVAEPDRVPDVWDTFPAPEIASELAEGDAPETPPSEAAGDDAPAAPAPFAPALAD